MNNQFLDIDEDDMVVGIRNVRPLPCRKHYFSREPFRDCPDCGWSGNFREDGDAP